MVKNILLEMPEFNTISNHALDALWKIGKVDKYKKNISVFRAREHTDFVYFQITGKSVIYNLTHDGKKKILFIFGPGALLNENITNFHTSSTFCDTLESSTILKAPVEDFNQLLREDFSFMQAILAMQERKMWRLGHQLKNTMGSIFIERKLAAKLWKLARDYGRSMPDGSTEIEMNISITFLADMLGVPRETASKACKKLIEYGLIAMDKKQFKIPDPDKLSDYYKYAEI